MEAQEAAGIGGQPDRQSERRVIIASSLGTVFEWYDFYLYGLLATIISSQFFSGVNETTGFILALAAFALTDWRSYRRRGTRRGYRHRRSAYERFAASPAEAPARRATPARQPRLRPEEAIPPYEPPPAPSRTASPAWFTR